MKKGGILCQEATEQALPAKGPEQGEAEVRVEEKWAGRLQQGRAEVACVRNAEQRLPILSDSLVTQKAALIVIQK